MNDMAPLSKSGGIILDNTSQVKKTERKKERKKKTPTGIKYKDHVYIQVPQSHSLLLLFYSLEAHVTIKYVNEQKRTNLSLPLAVCVRR